MSSGSVLPFVRGVDFSGNDLKVLVLQKKVVKRTDYLKAILCRRGRGDLPELFVGDN